MFTVTLGRQYITFFLIGQFFRRLLLSLYKTRIITWTFKSSASL